MNFPERDVAPMESAVYEFDGFRIDAAKRLVWGNGEPLGLTPKVFDTLFYLVKNAGKTIAKDELMAAIWPDTIVEENNLNKNISALRQLLGEKPGEHRFIATVPGKGYKFVASIIKGSVDGTQNADVVTSDGTLPSLIPSKGDTAGKTHRANSSYLRYGLAAALALSLLAAGFYLSQHHGSRDVEAVRSIAVLPFVDDSKDASNQY